MAKKYFTGDAPAIAQVVTAQITNPAVATTFRITVGDVTIGAVGTATATGTVAALLAAWAADSDDHAHTSRITASATGDKIKLTADVAGVPFDATSSVTGGSGTIGSVAVVTANSGPADVGVAANWSDGALPSNGDELFFSNLAQNVAYNLDAISATGLIVQIDQTYTGRIGLDPTVFAVDVNAETTTGVREYREDYLTLAAAKVLIGAHDGPGNPNGAGRLKLDNSATGASQTTVYNTAAQASETGRPAVRLLFGSADADLYVRQAPGGVGIGVGIPGETATVGDLYVSDPSERTRVSLGAGVTLANWTQDGGDNVIRAAADITKITVHGGRLRTEGDYQVTTMEINGGVVAPNHNHSATGAEIVTANLNGGTLDYSGSLEGRAVGTLNHKGGRLIADPDALTVTSYGLPTEKYQITVE